MARKSAKIVQMPGMKADEKVIITPPNFKYATAWIEGTAPYLSNAMSSEARRKMREGQEQGTANRSMKRRRPPKDGASMGGQRNGETIAAASRRG